MTMECCDWQFCTPICLPSNFHFPGVKLPSQQFIFGYEKNHAGRVVFFFFSLLSEGVNRYASCFPEDRADVGFYYP